MEGALVSGLIFVVVTIIGLVGIWLTPPGEGRSKRD
jgi:hypothetical protein